MFQHMDPAIAAVLADREREIEHNIRVRRQLDARAETQEQRPIKPISGAAIEAARAMSPRPAGPGGPAREAL